MRARIPLAATAIALAGCGGAPPANQFLSSYGLFKQPLSALQPEDGVIPYDVISILYADGAGKYRFVRLPQGKQIHFDPTERWTYPAGTVIAKTFDFANDLRNPQSGERLLETRILELGADRTWTANTFVWNDAQTDAERDVAGETLEVPHIDETGAQVTTEYRVPNTSQCKNCHGQNETIVPLGPRTRQLNRDHDYGAGPENQIAHFVKLGMFDGAVPDPAGLDHLSDPMGTDPVTVRARSYLDANCAHCHNVQGYASSTALRLNWETNVPIDLGVCRSPVAAGHAAGGFLYDVVPGDPASSILVYRMKSNDPEIKMPQLPLTTSDAFGVDLVSQWIAGLTPPGCP